MTERTVRVTTLTSDPGVEIDPCRVGPLDQIDLPFATPLLELFLPRDRVEDVVVAFKPNKKMNPISRRESAPGLRLVLVHATDQIVGHPYVEGPMFPACQDVNVVHDTSIRGYAFRAVIPGRGLYPPGPESITTSLTRPSGVMDSGLRHDSASSRAVPTRANLWVHRSV